MGSKRIMAIIGILLSIIGLVCISICIYQQGENRILLPFGLMCNSIALLLCCVNRKK